MNASRKAPSSRRKVSHDRTENSRIQKLLMSEYCEFSDTILVESPFAETTRDGRGIREVALGLTPSRLIIAADVFNKNSEFFCPANIDPSVESFELISVYPLEFITLSVFRRRRRKTLKARFIDGRANYYELGGMHHKNIFWKIWCEHVQNLLEKKSNGSSLSETTVASSSSTSTLYLLSSGVEFDNGNGKGNRKTVCRVWTHYGGAGDYIVPSWTQKNLYLGPSYEELQNGRYSPVPVRFAGASLEEVKYELADHSPSNAFAEKPASRSWPVCQNRKIQKLSRQGGGLCDVLFLRDRDNRYISPRQLVRRTRDSPRSWKTKNWVSAEFQEYQKSCDTRLSADKNAAVQVQKVSSTKQQRRRTDSKIGILVPKLSRFGFGVPEKCGSGLCLGPCRSSAESAEPVNSQLDPYKLIDSAVALWESTKEKHCDPSRKRRNLRRYGLSTAAHFLYALGPWSVQPGERESVQRRRSVSAVGIRRQPADTELRLPVSRRQLSGSVSCTALEPGKCSAIGTATKGRVVLFWTPEYWYRPRAATAAYRELRQHLTRLRDFRHDQELHGKKKFFCRRKRSIQNEVKVFENKTIEEKPSSLLGRMFSGNTSYKKKKKECQRGEDKSAVGHLRRLLRMDLRITIWDFDSTTLAEQLTLIDRDLFLRLPIAEIEILIFQRSSRNAPNLGAWIAFSHRISCLTVSEILSVKKLDMRSRIVVRFINAARKCLIMGNFHSCRSILAGLQAPPIYRLKTTWSYLREHHASRYEIMEQLCKVYKNPLTRSYQRAWTEAQKCSPCIPYVGDMLVRLLGLNKVESFSKPIRSSHRKQSKTIKSYSHPMLTQQTNQSVSSIVDSMKQPASCNIKQSITENDNATDRKESIARRVIKAALSQFRHRKPADDLHGCEDNLSWSSRQQDLAKKFFVCWRAQVLKSKILAEDERRRRSMDPRKKRLLDVVSWLIECQRQAQGYNYPESSFAWEFLLKARYREDRENFFVSLSLEPPKTT